MSRKRNFRSWTKETSALAHTAKAAKRMAGPVPDDWNRVPEGQHLGVLQWHAADGEVRRWTIKQGDRANSIIVSAKGKTLQCGWAKLFSGLRKKLAVKKVWLPEAPAPDGLGGAHIGKLPSV